ncbi:FAD-dependent monooxygenase [Undibacterium rugosum]|uniref:FAD-dependent monooxygenase n=1 Tax=Undibacterium rugosum TaxID=2762291 RepID=A0A923KS95_9BURK|nr:FAD-dependent monooxygenase [Undibacterium rugosum]MBC3934684.1 FAD-dependent monooxygenase [Undibacterium rugosum]MBR7779766.1 FAD-dependent monooxygenase [Undibacterium rugosum]
MTTIINDADIAICGAGPAGQALALLLVQQGIPAARIALFDGKTAAEAEQDARSIALSYGSQQILQQAACWPLRATAIQDIHVSRRGHFGRTLIQAADYQLPALGYVARYGDIVAPMQTAIARTGVQMHRPCQVRAIEELTDHVRLTVQTGTKTGAGTELQRQFSAQVVVQAEGGTFSDQSQRQQSRDYQQTAIIAHVCFDEAIAHRAFERFTEEGPLALLPQEDGYALVWCVRPDHAAQLMALDEATFRQRLQNAFGQRMGQLTRISTRVSYPLGLNAQAQASARVVSIGNAAQTLHPVAGQGLNLGLRDSMVLAKCLGRELAMPEAALQQFLRERQTDRSLTIGLTDTLARIFASSPDGSLKQSLLGLSLGGLDLFRPVRHLIAEHMLYGWRA